VAWATGLIDRYKLSLVVNLSAVEDTGGLSTTVKNDMALDNFGELGFVSGAAEVNPNTAVEVALLGSAGPLEWNSESLTYGYTYEQDGQSHQVWLGSEAVLAFQSRFALYHHVRGIAVSGLASIADAEGYANAIKSLVEATAGPQPASAAIVWAVEDESGAVVASSTGDTLAYAWQAPEQPGRYTIRADFAQGETIASLGTLDVLVQTPVAPTPEPTAAPVVEATATPISEVVGVDLGDADAVSEFNANVRNGPGQAYGVINGALKGTKVSLIGRNENSSWLQVTLADGTEGWIFADLLTISSSISIGSLAVVEVEPPPSIVTDGGTTPPPVIAPAGGGSFELGGQAFGAPYGQMQYAGMTWIKRQHKWSPGHTSQNVSGMISEAHNAGFNIMLFIPGADHGSIDFQAYAAFLGQVASLPDPPDAIEVWNEMNIDVEWPAGQISPSSYVQNMLIPASNAIKSANPNVMVISGAPAPTGFYGGVCGGGGCDDAPYVAGMAAAGAANYIDCIGIHYNEGILPPSQTSGDPRGSSGHYTRYFWGMVNTYYNAFGGSRPLCFTELGYLTPEGYGALPGGFAWAANVTVAQQAQWLAEATSLSANSGKVRIMIVWNVDSTTYGGHDPQAGYAIIRPGGSCLACDYLSQVMGR